MTEQVGASPQAANGPEFAAHPVNNRFYPTGVGPVLASMVDQSGTLVDGPVTLEGDADLIHWFVANIGTSSIILLFLNDDDSVGYRYPLGRAATMGDQGGSWSSSDFFWNKRIMVTGDVSSAFTAGYGLPPASET